MRMYADARTCLGRARMISRQILYNLAHVQRAFSEAFSEAIWMHVLLILFLRDLIGSCRTCSGWSNRVTDCLDSFEAARPGGSFETLDLLRCMKQEPWSWR
jgi:hypothetical protein